MSPLGQAIASWLARKPGPIKGDTYEQCIANALEACGIGKHVNADEFAAGMDRAGYTPQQRRKWGSDDGATYWIYVLPEKQTGSRS